MKNTSDFTKGYSAFATASLKPTNQDAGLLINNTEKNISGIVLADGLGSFFKAEEASRIVCESINCQIQELKDKNINFESLFQTSEKDLIVAVEQNQQWASQNFDINQAFGTTLICALEFEKEIRTAYLGNGAIIHLRGNYNDFPKSILLPWNALNYLNPHTVSLNGKEAMYKLISYQGLQYTPTELTFSKDLDKYGDIVMICTDGVYSSDQLSVGKSSDGKHWISGEESMKLFYKCLDDYFNQSKLTQQHLSNFLANYLEQLKQDNLMEDDCTIGLIITKQALQYQKKRTQEMDTKENGIWQFSLD